MNNQEVFSAFEARMIEKYKRRTPLSAKESALAQRCLPGGDTRTITFFWPYPNFIDKGVGCRLYDVDGNELLDFLNNYTSLIHGHAHPKVVEAVVEQIKKGTVFAAPVRNQHLLAEMICERIESVEQVRFCNSGTEATMMAIRTARHWSAKSKVVKMEGGYHGSHDLAEVSIAPGPKEMGPADSPHGIPQSKGIPKSILDEVIVVPFNNKEATENIVRQHSGEIACIIVEPVLGVAGLIPQENGYLKFLRDLSREFGIFLIFDEVFTFRVGWGGAQELYGVKPDITTLGKIIGGGFPVGAFGGSKEIMKLYSPLGKNSVSHSGTYNANPVTMAAGIATLRELTPKVYEHINSLGESLREGINSAFQKTGIKGQTTGIGSLAQPWFTAQRIHNYRDTVRRNSQVMRLLHLGLLERGIFIAPRGESCISTPMSEKEVGKYITAFEHCLAEVKPFVEQIVPELIQ